MGRLDMLNRGGREKKKKGIQNCTNTKITQENTFFCKLSHGSCFSDKISLKFHTNYCRKLILLKVLPITDIQVHPRYTSLGDHHSKKK